MNTNALPHVVILGTGGTLASVAHSRLEEHYDPAEIPVSDLLNDLPELNQIARISCEQVAQINSEHMTEDIWLKLARRVQDIADDDAVDGIVITHGTDTMEETSFFINLVINTKKPIVFTGAMRPANAISADGLRNLYNAVILASSQVAYDQGVLVTLNDVIHTARDITKTNVHTLDAFKSPDFGVLGYVQGMTPYLYRHATRRYTWQSEFNIKFIQSLPRVHIVYGYVGNNAALVEACVNDHAEGIISAGVGKGYQSEVTSEALIKARQQGVVVVRSSRVKNGIISREAELDDKHDFVVSSILNPQKGRILLALALTQTKDTKIIQRIFNDY